jgi:two-component system chemotaxis response regulator CheY
MAYKLLVADDSKTMHLYYKNALKDTEFEIVGNAHNGQEALDLYKELSPDVVTLDISMPDFDGTYALEHIVKYDPDALCFMASSLGTDEYVEKCMALGAKSFIQKPPKKEMLLEQFKKYL